MKIKNVADVAQKIVDLAPLAESGVGGAIELITGLIHSLHGTDLTQDIAAANAEGHRQVEILTARAEEAKAFLASQGAASQAKT